ncbi:winged helix-turn-helix domain-containing protein [Ramlibacter henchirensis]|nr:winged helix-turn-helix domain-containing protein [Ramlibacter henchirensis]
MRSNLVRGIRLRGEASRQLGRCFVEAFAQGAFSRQGNPMGTATLEEEGSRPVSRFGPFTLDARRAELHRNGATVALRPKTFALLCYLAEHPGRVIPKKELLAAVWPGVVVNDESLSQCVRELRGALGDDEQVLIRTVARRGYLFDASMESGATAATDRLRSPRPQRHWKVTAGTLLLAAVAALAGLAVVTRDDPVPVNVDDRLKERRSVAVMPFTDAPAAGQGRVADAITAGLVSALAKMPDTLVIGHVPGVDAAPNGDMRRTARQLRVRHLLTGSTQQDGDKVRVHAQLESSEDGAVFWSEFFEYAATADAQWQRDVASRIARVVDWRMSTAAVKRPIPGQGERLDPVEELMRGQHLLAHAASYDDLLRARAHFEAVAAADPGSAAAWTGVAQSYVSELEAAWNLGHGAVTLAGRALARARAANPQYLPAQYVAGRLLAMRGDLEGALRIYQAVAVANPSDAWAHARIGAMKLRLGQLADAETHTRAALRLGSSEAPLVAFSHLQAGLAEYYLGHDAIASEHLRQSVAAGPCLTQLEALLLLTSIDASNGRGQEARERAAEVLRLRPRFTVGAWRVWTAPVHPQLQPLRDRFLDGLAKAGLPE